MPKYILISVFGREIIACGFDSYENAKGVMMSELYEEFLLHSDAEKLDEEWERIAALDCYEGDEFGFDSYSAWSNMSQKCDCDWKIYSIEECGCQCGLSVH